jgi:hypothetical protein
MSTDVEHPPPCVSSVMVQLIGSSAAHVTVWDARRPERRVGTLHPRGSLVPNATDQLLVTGVRSGDVITVIAPECR